MKIQWILSSLKFLRVKSLTDIANAINTGGNSGNTINTVSTVLSTVNTVNTANTAGDIKYFIVGSRILSLDFFYHLLTFSEQSGSIQ